jgi:hypothetical protein
MGILTIAGSLVTATYITMTVTISSDDVFHQNSTIISASVIQSGDEAAYDVEVKPIESEEFNVTGSLSTKILEPGETLQGNFTIHATENILEGKYPFVIRVIYQDVNGYPFSIVASHLLTYVNGYSSSVFGTISELEITQEGSGEATLKIRNLDERSHNVKIHLYLPRELKSTITEKNISLGAREEEEIKVEIESFGAVTGSSYVILASIEYQNASYHYSSFANGMVKIVEKKENLYIFWIVIVIFVILLMVFIYYKLRGVSK